MRAIIPTLAILTLLGAIPARAADAVPEAPLASSAYPLPPDIQHEAGTLLSAMRRHDMGAIELSLQRLTGMRLEAGISNLTAISAALSAGFADASQSATPAVAVRVATLATRIAPDVPEAWWLLSRTHLREGFSGLGAASGAAVEALSAYPRHPRILLLQAAGIASYLLGALILVLLVVSLAFLVRHGRLLAHDVGDLFPSAPATPFSAVEMAQSRRFQAIVGSGLTRVLALSLVGLLLLLPLVLGFGLVPSMAIWLLLVMPYLRRAETVTAALACIGIALLPFLAALVLLPGRAATTDGARMWAALEESPRQELVPVLARRTLEHPDEPWAPILQARMDVRGAPFSAGALEAAASRLERVAAEPSGVAATDLANVRLRLALESCREGRMEAARVSQARDAFERALRLAPGDPAVLRGLALTSGFANDREAQDKALQALMGVTQDADLDTIARVRSVSSPSAACAAPRAVAGELRLVSPPDLPLYLADVQPFEIPSSLPLNGWLMGRTAVSWLPILGIGGLFVLLLLAVLGQKLHFSSACPRCGTVSCPSCNRHASGFDYCPTCLFEQVKPAFIDPLDVVAMQRRRDEHLSWTRQVRPILTLVLPGVGQLLSGRPLRGALLLLLLFLAIGSVLFPVPPLVDVDAYACVAGKGLPLAPPVTLAVVYLISALDTWVNRAS